MSLSSVNESWVGSVAPNAAAVKNGRALVSKLESLHKTEDLLFADCPGSGKLPYGVSVDFIDPQSPVYRCTCPSRQIPCKHALGLLLAYCAAPSRFTEAPVPPDVAEKRDKQLKRREKKTEESEKPRKPKTVNNAAIIKKAAAQAEGLEKALKLAATLVQEGLGAQTPRTLLALREHNRGLGDYYIPGVQTAFAAILQGLSHDDEQQRQQAYKLLAVFQTLCRRSLQYFGERQQDPAKLDARLESWCGRVWQLSELSGMGLVTENARLLQLDFSVIDNEAAQEFEETALWADIDTGELYFTRNLRPYKAMKYIRAEDSTAALTLIPRLLRYPLAMRVRWDESRCEDTAPEHCASLLAHAEPELSAAIKRLREQQKDPMGLSLQPALIRFRSLDSDGKGRYWLTDTAGSVLELTGHAALLPLALRSGDCALALYLTVDEHNTVVGQPLALLRPDGLTRLGG